MFQVYNSPTLVTEVLNNSEMTEQDFQTLIDTIPAGLTKTFFIYSGTAEAIGLPKKSFFVIACYGIANTKIVLAFSMSSDTELYKMFKSSSGWRSWIAC